ncbi:RNA ligase [Halobacteriales archaeon QS_1_68_20]|nr:MAG: RNA ligase [Halobacteriales archaeon QS_1_68_20]
MDERAYLTRLGATADDPADLFEHFERRTVAGRTHHVLTDVRHGVECGTVIVEDADAVVRGYPSIPRVLVLDPGVPEFFDADERIAVEEKLDGFNVRIADVGEPLAFTRSGYVCPYTTDRARELLPLADFFADHPEKMLCAELIGPETPYTTHDYDEVDSHEFRVFDVRDRETGDPLPVEHRRDVCETYGVGQPRLFDRCGPTAAVDAVREAISELDATAREGVVLKSADGQRTTKYTTGTQHRSELAHGFSLLFECGRDFLFSRLLREGFQAAEFESDDRLRERAHDLGESILLPMVETIRRVEDGDSVGERHAVRGNPDAIEELLGHLRGQGLTLEIEADRREDGQRVLEFRKVAESTRDRTAYYLAGGTRDE